MTDFNEIKDLLVKAKEEKEPITVKFGEKEITGHIQEIDNNNIVIKSNSD